MPVAGRVYSLHAKAHKKVRAEKLGGVGARGMLSPMTHARPRPDHDALAASLRTWALGFAGWLLDALDAHAVTRSMRRWVHLRLAHVEKGVAGLIALAALRLLPAPLALARYQGKRPLAAPQGFVRIRIHRRAMRGLLRALFPRQRDLARRCARLLSVLQKMDAYARMIARRLPVTRLALVRPPVMRLCACAVTSAPTAPDTS